MIDNRYFEFAAQPFECAWIGALTRQKDSFKSLRPNMHEREFGIFLSNGANGGGCGEENVDLVFSQHPPKCASIGRTDWLTFI